MSKLQTILASPASKALQGRDFLSVADYTPEQLFHIFKVTRVLKEMQKAGVPQPVLQHKILGMIFQKASTRTRVSFEVGMLQLGGQALFLSSRDIQLGRGETIEDTARVLSRYLDGIMIRTFDHQEVEALAQFANIPVINGLTDLLHPCQALADFFTAWEHKGRLTGLTLAFIGDGNNVAHSLMLTAAKFGVNFRIACPEGYEPKETIWASALQLANAAGCQMELVRDPRKAAAGADILYTDVWASMGQEAEQKARQAAFAGYQINLALLAQAAPDAIVMHCLPAHRGEEITSEVLDGPQSVVWDEAENRLHVQKAIMALVMG